MAVEMICKFCGARFVGSAAEAIRWDTTHDEFCPGDATVTQALANAVPKEN